MVSAREAIGQGRYEDYRAEVKENWTRNGEPG
jgi:hypothetical protein